MNLTLREILKVLREIKHLLEKEQGTENIEVKLEIDGKEVGKAVDTVIAKQSQRYSQRLGHF